MPSPAAIAAAFRAWARDREQAGTRDRDLDRVDVVDPGILLIVNCTSRHDLGLRKPERGVLPHHQGISWNFRIRFEKTDGVALGVQVATSPTVAGSLPVRQTWRTFNET